MDGFKERVVTLHEVCYHEPVPLPGDECPALHLGLYDGTGRIQLLVATGNVRAEPAPWATDRPGWRLRGMATDPAYRSRGAGRLVLDGLVAYAQEQTQGRRVGLLWCNARIPAQAFYERAGLSTIGAPWDDPEIGPHVQMWREL